MRNRSAAWMRLAARGNFRLETVAVINGVEYSAITAPVIVNGLLPDKTLSVGNCISGTLRFTVKTNDVIPKSAEIVIKSRITDETTYSEWLEFGHFWIDKRTIIDDLDEKLITLDCFDAMLKGNQPYVDNSQTMNWPKDMRTVVNRIAEQMGVQVDPRTVIRTGNDYVIYKPDDDVVLLDILRDIGSVHGGNWTITPENKLRLVPLVSAPPETFYIIDENYWRITTPEGDNLVSRHGESYVQPNGIGHINVPVVLGDITTAKTYVVSRVTMVIDEETSYTAGDDTGFELKITTSYATQAICNTLYGDLNGLVYAPFNMTKACFDPAVELGDMLFAGDQVHGVMYIATQNFDASYSVDASAPGEDELESEYPYKTTTQKTDYRIRGLKKENAALSSRITQTQESITAEVTRASQEEGRLSSRITQNATNIELKVDANNVIAAINVSPETIVIDATKINLSGYVTFTSLSTPGSTNIDGGNITTGTLSADRIGANSIAVSKLTGTISGGNNWSIDLTTGTMTIGNISATNITAGELNTDLITIKGTAKIAGIIDCWQKIEHNRILGGYTYDGLSHTTVDMHLGMWESSSGMSKYGIAINADTIQLNSENPFQIISKANDTNSSKIQAYDLELIGTNQIEISTGRLLVRNGQSGGFSIGYTGTKTISGVYLNFVNGIYVGS